MAITFLSSPRREFQDHVQFQLGFVGADHVLVQVVECIGPAAAAEQALGDSVEAVAGFDGVGSSVGG